MGGHRAGDVASRLATDAIVDFFRATAVEDVTWPFHFDARLSEEENRLLTGIRIANRQIIERSARLRECHGMGTTVVGALFSAKKRRMYIGHVGDSRAYRIRDGGDPPDDPRSLARERLPARDAGIDRGAAQ
jgi:protein phosphatase